MSDRATYALRFIDSGIEKIDAIKLIDALTQIGYARAYDTIDQQLVFMEGLDHVTANAIVDRFAAETESLVALIEEGLETAERELDVVIRTSAREPRLEQAIREADDPDAAMAVHADWLQRQGDPRGIVAALDLARAKAASAEARARLDQAFADALTEHHARLFGSLPPAAVSAVQLEWRGGLVMGISVDPRVRSDPDWPRPFSDFAVVEDLLALPICACLRSLRVDTAATGGPGFATKLMSSDPAMLGNLRELVLLSHSAFKGVLDWSRMPALERLELVVGETAPFDLPKLRALDITLWRADHALQALRKGTLPCLRSLTLCFDNDAFERGWPPVSGTLHELLALPLLVELDTLVLRSAAKPWPLWLIQTVINSPKLQAVGRVDLREVELDRLASELLLANRERLTNFVID